MGSLNKLTAAAIILLASGVCLADPPAVEWVARYNGPAGGDDYANDLALDSDGCVIVVGASEGVSTGIDMMTIKYDIDGNELWKMIFDGGGGDWDEAMAVALDPDGNVYVTGWSCDTDYNYDFTTIKYDGSGGLQWVAYYDGPDSGVDAALDIAVTSTGYICVTGYSESLSTGYDYATVLYDTDGNEEWVSMYNGAADMSDEPYAVAADGEGGVYVTGSSFFQPSCTEFATLKYSSTGSWYAGYAGQAGGADFATDIAASTDHVYVTGPCYEVSGNRDYVTVQYDLNGTENWSVSYDGPGSDTDYPEALAADASGNVYVTGESIGSGTYYDFATVKYDVDGTELWVARYDGDYSDDDEAYDIALDPYGNAYVTGYVTMPDDYSDYCTIAYDSLGNELWVMTYDGPGAESDEAVAVVADDLGNVWVTGGSYGTGTGSDFATIRYSQELGIGGTEGTGTVSLKVSPNPSGGFISIEYTLPATAGADICIFDLSGRLVRESGHSVQDSGPHTVEIDALSPGLYFCRLETDGLSATQSFVVIR